jgi:type IV pilus assembly protein PilC
MTPEHLQPDEPTGAQSVLHATLWFLKLFALAVVGVLIIGLLAAAIGSVLLPALASGETIDWFVVGGRAVGPLSGLLLLLVLTSALLAALRRRRSHAVLAYLEQAMRLNLPLPAMLRAAERSERGGVARAVRRVRVELEGGQSVHDALAAALPGAPPRAIGLVGAAERSGRLPRALERLGHEAVTRFAGRPGAELFLRWYPPTLALVMGLIVTCVYVFVIPKYMHIFRDFKLALPRPTMMLVRTWELIAAPIVVVVVAATLLYVGRMVTAILLPRSVGPGPLRWMTDRITWAAPAVAGMTRWRALADTCHVMADALEAGHTFERALTEASRSGTNDVLAEKLGVWSDHARAGLPPAEGARRAGMPPLIVGLLRTASGADHVELLRFLARYYDGRFARSAVVLQAALVPALTIVMGAIVGSIVYCLFLPLIGLVENLSQAIWKM